MTIVQVFQWGMIYGILGGVCLTVTVGFCSWAVVTLRRAQRHRVHHIKHRVDVPPAVPLIPRATKPTDVPKEEAE